MAETLFQTVSTEEILCTWQIDSVFSGNKSEYLLMGCSLSTKKSSKRALVDLSPLQPNLRKIRLKNVWTLWRRKWKNSTFHSSNWSNLLAILR